MTDDLTWNDIPIDKSEWGDGPWQDEDDEVSWAFGDVPCRIVRNPHSGSLCGYVGIPPSHPWYGADCMDDLGGVSVHGGVTWSGQFADATWATRTPDATWWVGFDCAHAWDVTPGFTKLYGVQRDYPAGYAYRTMAYVRGEVERLAQQAIGAGR